jgi:hypothetical protein
MNHLIIERDKDINQGKIQEIDVLLLLTDKGPNCSGHHFTRTISLI